MKHYGYFSYHCFVATFASTYRRENGRAGIPRFWDTFHDFVRLPRLRAVSLFSLRATLLKAANLCKKLLIREKLLFSRVFNFTRFMRCWDSRKLVIINKVTSRITRVSNNIGVHFHFGEYSTILKIKLHRNKIIYNSLLCQYRPYIYTSLTIRGLKDIITGDLKI